MLRHLIFAAAIAGVLAGPGLAQDDIPVFNGVAVSQAPEAGLGVCFGPDQAETMACAQQQCMEQSGLGELDCGPNLWCYPHGWVAQIAVMHNEGIHWSKVICDEMSQESLDRAVAAYCEDTAYIECGAVRIWDWDGNEVLGYE